MLQNASYMFFFLEKETKQNKATSKKTKTVSSDRSRTQDLGRVRVTHYPLRHATIAKIVCQINCI